jgi:hypothetical protein
MSEKSIFEIMENIKRMSDCVLAANEVKRKEKELPSELWAEVY